MPIATPVQWILACILLLSSAGVLLVKKPVHASLSFLLTLLTLAALYLQLSAEFIAVMQVLVYAGAILVIFMFVIVLFQDAHLQIARYKSKSASFLILFSSIAFFLTLLVVGKQIGGLKSRTGISENFGTVQSLGEAIYIDFFFPFEAVILLFLVAVVGALYIGKRG